MRRLRSLGAALAVCAALLAACGAGTAQDADALGTDETPAIIATIGASASGTRCETDDEHGGHDASESPDASESDDDDDDDTASPGTSPCESGDDDDDDY